MVEGPKRSKGKEGRREEGQMMIGESRPKGTKRRKANAGKEGQIIFQGKWVDRFRGEGLRFGAQGVGGLLVWSWAVLGRHGAILGALVSPYL